MMSVENSRLLAIKLQYAIYNNDINMIKKIEKIKRDSDITKEIIEYKIKKD